MYRLFIRLFILIFAGILSLQAEGQKHPFVCCDYTAGKISVISPDGKLLWDYPAEKCNDITVLPNGNLLFNCGKGVKEVTRNRKVVFEYHSESELFACQRLKDGTTFIGECNSGKLLIVRPDGTFVSEINLLPEGTDGGFSFMRNARKLENGNYLVAHYGLDKVCEYNSQGKILREIPITGGPHSVIRLKNGNTLIACSDHNGEPRIVEIDPTGKIVWQLEKNDLPGIELRFMTGMEVLPNHHLVLTNWIGHRPDGETAHAFEIDKKKKVIWKYTDRQVVQSISSIQMIKSNGKPLYKSSLH